MQRLVLLHISQFRGVKATGTCAVSQMTRARSVVLMAGASDMDGCTCRSGLASGGQGTIQERAAWATNGRQMFRVAWMFLFVRRVADWARLPGTIEELLPGALRYTHHDGFLSSKRLGVV